LQGRHIIGRSRLKPDRYASRGRLDCESSVSTSFILAVWMSVVRRPSPSTAGISGDRLFFLTIVWGQMARSTMLESISTLPSWRTLSRLHGIIGLCIKLDESGETLGREVKHIVPT